MKNDASEIQQQVLQGLVDGLALVRQLAANFEASGFVEQGAELMSLVERLERYLPLFHEAGDQENT